MSATTSRVSLYKPAGGENVNVTTDLNNNWDKIDTNLNFRVVANTTARNAITPYWEGLGVRQTDTGKVYVTNGSAPISASWNEIVQVGNETAGEMLVGNLIRSTRALSNDSAYEGRITGDTNARWFVKASGETWWGPGNAIQDTNLYRTGANQLHTDDNFDVGQNLTVSGNSTITGIGQTRYADMTTTQTWTSNTTLSNVSDFSFSVVANSIYIYKLVLFASSAANAAGDIKFTFTCPTGATLDFTGNGPDAGLASGATQTGDWVARTNISSAGNTIQYGLSTTVVGIIVEGKVNVSSTSGTLQFQAAQLASNANTTSLLARSYMTIERVE